MIAKNYQILDLQPRISKVFLDHYLDEFFLTVGQNKFGNKIPFFQLDIYISFILLHHYFAWAFPEQIGKKPCTYYKMFSFKKLFDFSLRWRMIIHSRTVFQTKKSMSMPSGHTYRQITVITH